MYNQFNLIAVADTTLMSGFSITPEELLSRIKGHIASSKVEGWNNVNSFLGSLRTSRDLRWASPLEVKSVVESEFTELFGPKTKASVYIHLINTC